MSYVWNVAVVGWGVVCTLTRWRWLDVIASSPAFVVGQLPLVAAYLVIVYTVLALDNRDFASPSGAAAGGFAHFSEALLARVEKAERSASPALIAACDTALDAGGALTRLLTFAQSYDPATAAVPATLLIHLNPNGTASGHPAHGAPRRDAPAPLPVDRTSLVSATRGRL